MEIKKVAGFFSGITIILFFIFNCMQIYSAPQKTKGHQSNTSKKPNLVLEKIEWIPVKFKDGDSVKLNFIITNRGDKSSKLFQTRFTIPGQLTKTFQTRSLHVGQRKTYSYNFTGHCGNQLWEIMADSTKSINEGNENDNKWKTNLNIQCTGKPYLTIHSVRTNPFPFSMGNTLKTEYTIQNRGNSFAPPSIIHIKLNDNLKSVVKIPALNQSEKILKSFTWKVSAYQTRIRIISDALNKIDETNEGTDKNYDFTMKCSGENPNLKPDLFIEKIELIPSQPKENKPQKIKVKIRNKYSNTMGSNSGPSNLMWKIMGQEKPVHSIIERIGIPSITGNQGKANAFYVLERNYPNGLFPQRYKFTLIVDQFNKVDESNENNNESVREFTVNPSVIDLRIKSIWSPDPERRIGREVKIVVTLINTGSANSGPFSIKVKCYKNKVRNKRINSLKAGSEVKFECYFRWSSIGSKLCQVWVDSNNEINEDSLESNNYREYKKIKIKL